MYDSRLIQIFVFRVRVGEGLYQRTAVRAEIVQQRGRVFHRYLAARGGERVEQRVEVPSEPVGQVQSA